MPYRMKKPCKHPGCPELTDGQYCPAHQAEAVSHYNRYERDPYVKKQYGRRWQKIRAAYVREHPLCEMCLAEGRHTPVEEVHHVLPIARGGTHAESNLMSLCRSCHSRITSSESRR